MKAAYVDIPKVTQEVTLIFQKSRFYVSAGQKVTAYVTHYVTLISNYRDITAFPQVRKSRGKSRHMSRTPLYEVEGC